nr:MAG TPA: hypothetical protein [Caudoviricetes sp.]
MSGNGLKEREPTNDLMSAAVFPTALAPRLNER